MSGSQMLYFKAWRESRTRFLISAAVIATFCVVVVLFSGSIQAHADDLPVGLRVTQYNAHVYHFIYSGTLKGIFAMLVIFLGLGGLLRERQRGTAWFTLGLPVTRNELIASQVSVGLVQVVALALLPVLLVPTLSPLVHQSYPVRDSLHFAVLWCAGGTLEFAMAFLWSVVVAGEYTALVAAFLVLFGIPLVAQVRVLEPYQVNILQTMGEFGTMQWNMDHTLLVPPALSQIRLTIFALIAVGMIATALRITQRQDL
ncbi:MAG: hypothetical protein ABI969_15285 [bacterium]